MYCIITQRAWYVLGLHVKTPINWYLAVRSENEFGQLFSLMCIWYLWHSSYRVCSLIVLLVRVSWGWKVRPQNHHRTRNAHWVKCNLRQSKALLSQTYKDFGIVMVSYCLFVALAKHLTLSSYFDLEPKFDLDFQASIKTTKWEHKRHVFNVWSWPLTYKLDLPSQTNQGQYTFLHQKPRSMVKWSSRRVQTYGYSTSLHHNGRADDVYY